MAGNNDPYVGWYIGRQSVNTRSIVHVVQQSVKTWSIYQLRCMSANVAFILIHQYLTNNSLNTSPIPCWHFADNSLSMGQLCIPICRRLKRKPLDSTAKLTHLTDTRHMTDGIWLTVDRYTTDRTDISPRDGRYTTDIWLILNWDASTKYRLTLGW